MAEEKKLTELQENFLSILFSAEAAGDPTTAARLAGYSENTSVSTIVNTLSDEIRDRAKKFLGVNSAKAAYALITSMDNSAEAGVANKIKAAEAILARAGVKETEETVREESGLVILPAKTKSVSINIVTEDEDEK